MCGWHYVVGDRFSHCYLPALGLSKGRLIYRGRPVGRQVKQARAHTLSAAVADLAAAWRSYISGPAYAAGPTYRVPKPLTQIG